MENFYTELQKAMEMSGEDIWAETVLTGKHKGEKHILHTEPAERTRDHNVFCERISRTPSLVICGAGHVSIPIIRMGKVLGFSVSVLEDRPKFADHARQAEADNVICEAFDTGLAQIQGSSDTWFVIVTRGHRYDALCLETILGKQYAYVGMMGSRRRVALVKEQLEEKGLSREILDAVHTPIGLKIGAETPEEIAVSIMAEIIQIKNSRKKSGGYSPELLRALVGDNACLSGKKKVLATIISRKGSAPRGVGTKMLVMEDGAIIDTIGGGCVESEIIQKALLMMRVGEPKFQVCRVDMTADAAEEEGMVCGGVVEVMLELV